MDRTFGLVINKGDLDCIMCLSDQIERRMNMYRDKVERVLRLSDLEDEYGTQQQQQRRGRGRVVQQRRLVIILYKIH